MFSHFTIRKYRELTIFSLPALILSLAPVINTLKLREILGFITAMTRYSYREKSALDFAFLESSGDKYRWDFTYFPRRHIQHPRMPASPCKIPPLLRRFTWSSRRDICFFDFAISFDELLRLLQKRFDWPFGHEYHAAFHPIHRHVSRTTPSFKASGGGVTRIIPTPPTAADFAPFPDSIFGSQRLASFHAGKHEPLTSSISITLFCARRSQFLYCLTPPLCHHYYLR